MSAKIISSKVSTILPINNLLRILKAAKKPKSMVKKAKSASYAVRAKTRKGAQTLAKQAARKRGKKVQRIKQIAPAMWLVYTTKK